MIIEGKNAVFEALNSGVTINKFYAENNLRDNISNKIIKLAKDNGIRINFVNKEALDNISKTKKHQGFVIDTVDFVYSELEEIIESAKQNPKGAFIVILDGIEDPHNFGAIIRTCECANVDGIIIPIHRACQVTDTVIRISSGASFQTKIARVTNLNQTIEKLKKQDIWVYALELGGENIYKTNLKGNIALVVGSEGFGVSNLVKKNCDGVVTLPMKGKINSLNASVATGIAVYEILNQKEN